MKIRSRTLNIGGSALFSLLLVGNPLLGQGPRGWLVAGNDSTPLLSMSSTWDSGEGRIHFDTFRNFRPVEELDLDAKEVGPGDTLAAVFTPVPTAITIKPYTGSAFERDPTLSPASFPAPTDPGFYYYEVEATWEQGEGVWIFRIQIVSGPPEDLPSGISTRLQPGTEWAVAQPTGWT